MFDKDAQDYIIDYAALGRGDIALVGGKNASLGELIGRLGEAGVRVPGGFAVTASAYRKFLADNALEDELKAQLDRYEHDPDRLAEIGEVVRKRILDADIPDDVAASIAGAYREMSAGGEDVSVAVRSSATAEDLPEASFAGQLETFLNVSGEKALLAACKKCFASLYTDRATSYRTSHGFSQSDIAISVGVQQMVRADEGASGVMFSIDTDSGFPNSILINGAWGLGETVVQGTVDPDEFEVFKPLLDNKSLTPIVHKKRGAKEIKLIYARGGASPVKLIKTTRAERDGFVLGDDDIMQLARWAVIIESHYGQSMDMEWAKDGVTGDLYIVQARPETVQSRRAAGVIEHYELLERGDPIVSGAAIGDAIATGAVCRIKSADQIADFKGGAVLVAEMTDPDWVPIMKKAAAIITDHGGRTSHAAIVARELNLPAIVGAGDATSKLADGREITVSCAEGATGFVYDGLLPFERREEDIETIPKTRTKIMLNMANPAAAYRWWRLPSDGVGLARIEFIISAAIKAHPMALVRFDVLEDKKARAQIETLTAGYDDKKEFFVDQLAQGVSRIAAAHYPNPVIVRLSDFKTDEYARLIGGAAFEPDEANPMLGWRGASRYYHEDYREGFALECRAMKRVREDIGLSNVKLMIPFCRTLEEADKVLGEMEKNGLMRGEDGLEIFVMAELPSNILLADGFAERFDGFSIGSNDLTQLVLGVDRNSDRLGDLFDERNDAVKRFIGSLIETAKAKGAPVGICGQAPSDYPDFAAFLVEAGIHSISVTPDSFIQVKNAVAAAEAKT